MCYTVTESYVHNDIISTSIIMRARKSDVLCVSDWAGPWPGSQFGGSFLPLCGTYRWQRHPRRDEERAGSQWLRVCPIWCSMLGAQEVDRYGRHVGSLALWLWGDKSGCVFAWGSPCPGSGWRRCWAPLLKAVVPAGGTPLSAIDAPRFLLPATPSSRPFRPREVTALWCC